jgi:hypothetical protein
MPKRTELSKRSSLSSTETLFPELTLTVGAAAGGASGFEASSVSVVAILDSGVDCTIAITTTANSNKR